MKFILGTKKRMTQIFDAGGRVIPATVVAAGPVFVTQVKTVAKDGYEAIQVGFGHKKTRRVPKPQRALRPDWPEDRTGFVYRRELRTPVAGVASDTRFTVADFAEGDTVAVSGGSKAKGFQGVVKRHGFKGGPRTHGQKHNERAPGSIGATGPQKVLKGMRMGGRMGGGRVTVKNLKVVRVDPERNELLIAGALPGRVGTLLEIRG